MARRPDDPEHKGWLIAAMIVTLIVVGLFVEALGVTLLVGITDMEPRAAAGLMLGPATFLGVIATQIRPIRRLVCQWTFLNPPLG